MKRILLLTLVAAAAGPVLADDCAFTARRDADIPAAGLSQFKLQTTAGDLQVTGVPGLDKIELRGRACASSAEALEQLQLRHDRSGADLRAFTTTVDDKSGFNLFGSNYAYIDLEVRMPQGLALELQDSSGDVVIEDAGSLDITDSSGDLRIRDPRGDVRIRDTSGDIEIREAQGSVTVVSDSSGDIEVDGARRDVVVEDDSSGEIELENVSGNVRVGRDSSGDITFKQIGGNAEIGTDSSGTIRADHIKGDFRVGSKSGGRSNIEYSDVGGKVSIPND
jgi:Putative adhesin